MPDARIICHQIKKLTVDLVGLSLCDQQNFPALRDLRQGYQEIGISGKANLNNLLKTIPYRDIYAEIERTENYNIKMLDGAFIQIMYLFRNNQITKHRLAFYPSPHLEEFQNNPEIYLHDEMYAEVTRKAIVPFPLRFDFDRRDHVATDADHPASHLTLGQYQNCRIPVSAPITPYHFISFTLRSFYNSAFRKHCTKISHFTQAFESSMTPNEMKSLYMRVPYQGPNSN